MSPDFLSMPADVRSYVASRGLTQADYPSLEAALPGTDVLYATRIQRERFSDQAGTERRESGIKEASGAEEYFLGGIE